MITDVYTSVTVIYIITYYAQSYASFYAMPKRL